MSEGVERDGGDDRHLHRGDEAEAFEQEVREGDESVGGRLPQLHRGLQHFVQASA